MKVGFNLLLWTGGVTEEHLPLLAKIKSWGAEGVEIPIFDPAGSPWKKIAAELDNLGLERTAVAVPPPGTNMIGDDAAERASAVEYMKRMIDACNEVGVTCVGGPVCSPVGRLVGRGPSEDERKRAAEGLRAAGEYAAQHGVTIAVEALNRFETYILNTMEQASALIDMVGLDNVGHMYDTFHANIEEKDSAAAIKASGKRIKHVHISACDRGTPGDDHIDYLSVMKALKSIGYDGWLTIESFGHSLPELAGATCIWRQVAPSDEYCVKNGVAFTKKTWAAA